MPLSFKFKIILFKNNTRTVLQDGSGIMVITICDYQYHGTGNVLKLGVYQKTIGRQPSKINISKLINTPKQAEKTNNLGKFLFQHLATL